MYGEVTGELPDCDARSLSLKINNSRLNCRLFQQMYKNVSSSTSTKNCETARIRGFSFFLSSTFIYELILIKISMNANVKTILILNGV